jgi:hypothetical protein
LWYVKCCSIRVNHLSQPWHLSFSMMTTTLAWKHDKQVVISSVGGSCWYVLEGGPWGYDAEPMMVGRLGIQIEIRAFYEKIAYSTAEWIGALSMLRCHTISGYIWCIHLNGICWNHTQIQSRSLKPASTNDLYHLSHKTKCIVHQSNNNMLANGTPTTFQFDTFLTTLQNAIGQGWKSDVRLAKRFVWENKLSKMVQFLQPNNDDMMK